MVKSCPVCGSRKWRKDAVTGSAVCEDGHVFQDYRSEDLVVENVQHTLQRRTLRKGPRINKRREEGRANKEYYNGLEAEWLKVEALQLLLRLQIRALIELLQLPDTYELIVRELWAYQLAVSSLPPRPGADISTSPPESAPATSSKPEALDNSSDFGKAMEDNKEDDNKSDDGFESSDEGEDEKMDEEEDGVDPELLALMSESSGGEEDKEEDLSSSIAGMRRIKGDARWRRKRKLGMSDTLVTLLLGLWTIRYPILHVEFQRLVNDNRLPYLDYGHTTYIPPEMSKRMNRDIQLALSPRRSPSPSYLFDSCRQLARILSCHCSITFPEINLPPLGWNIISRLGGNPTIHAYVNRTLALLDVNLSLHDTSTETRTRKVSFRGRQFDVGDGDTLESKEIVYQRTTRYNDIVMPELSIVAAWVIVMKLAYGLQGQDSLLDGRSYEISSSELPIPPGNLWLQKLSERLDKGYLRGTRAFLDRQDFASIEEDGMDRYLNHAQHVLLADHSLETDAGPFPLIPPVDVAAVIPDTWSDLHSTLGTTQPRPSSAAAAGAADAFPPEKLKLRSYEAEDLTGQLPPDLELVLRAAAEVVGVTQLELAKVVENFERRLEKVRKAQSRSRSRSRSQSQSRSRSAGASRAASGRRIGKAAVAASLRRRLGIPG